MKEATTTKTAKGFKVVDKRPDVEIFRILSFDTKCPIFASSKQEEVYKQLDVISKQIKVAVDAFGIYTKPYWQVTHYCGEYAPKA